MKKLIATLIVLFSINANAIFGDIDCTNPDRLTEDQRIELLETLNQLPAEALVELLNDEALIWYVNQFTRGGEFMTEDEIYHALHGRIDIIENPFDDENAPTFDEI